MGPPGWIGWTEAPVSTVPWAALDSMDYKMKELKHLEYQDQSVGAVHKHVWPIKPGVGVFAACVYNERDFASGASPRNPDRLISSRVPPSQVCARQFSSSIQKLTHLVVNLGKWLEEIRPYFVIHVGHGS
jgi:hypothetical protein